MSKQLSKPESNLKIVSEFNDAVFEDNDLDRLDEFVSPEFVQYESGEVTAEGIDGLTEYFEGMIATYEDLTMEVFEIVADDDTVIYRFRIDAIPQGEIEFDGEWVDAESTPLSWDGFVSLTIEDGKITEANLLTDDIAVYRQLGLIPETAA